jgi:hypothetical protein
MWTLRDARLSAVRWERLFADLEAQYDAAADAEFSGEVADRSRREIALVPLVDRLRSTDGLVQVGAAGCEPMEGAVASCGPDWLLLMTDANVETLVPIVAIAWVRGLNPHAESERSVVAARLDLRYALRGLARDRAEVTVTIRTGERFTGTIDRVGADFVELAEHPLGEPRRAGAVRSTRAVPFTALSCLRRQG